MAKINKAIVTLTNGVDLNFFAEVNKPLSYELKLGAPNRHCLFAGDDLIFSAQEASVLCIEFLRG